MDTHSKKSCVTPSIPLLKLLRHLHPQFEAVSFQNQTKDCFTFEEICGDDLLISASNTGHLFLFQTEVQCIFRNFKMLRKFCLKIQTCGGGLGCLRPEGFSLRARGQKGTWSETTKANTKGTDLILK